MIILYKLKWCSLILSSFNSLNNGILEMCSCYPLETPTDWGGHGSPTAPPQRSHQTPHFQGVDSKPWTETGLSAEIG